jgi:hypothetical protein
VIAAYAKGNNLQTHGTSAFTKFLSDGFGYEVICAQRVSRAMLLIRADRQDRSLILLEILFRLNPTHAL